MRLMVYLGALPIAHIEQHEDQSLYLRFLESYRGLRGRPTLSQYYIDKLEQPRPGDRHLPNFFANLLPEGTLRMLVARAAGAREHQELRLLCYLGEDLPGNVRIEQTGEFADGETPTARGDVPRMDADKLRFSLAGVQLKFSMVREGKGLVLPASGRGGNWILKLPDLEVRDVPENEFSTMTWARECGIDVPEFELMSASHLSGIDPRFLASDSPSFAIRRFDRAQDGVRVHIEDFAQVFGRPPIEKYDEARPVDNRVNYETLARAILAFCGEEDLRAFVRRLVFMVLSGNADAHLKNWSLIYSDGRNARLAPAYDQVATVVYPQFIRELALPFHGSQAFETVSEAGFRRLAGKLKRSPDEVARWIHEDVTRIMDAWSGSRIPRSFEYRMAVGEHHRSLRSASGSLLKP